MHPNSTKDSPDQKVAETIQMGLILLQVASRSWMHPTREERYHGKAKTSADT